MLLVKMLNFSNFYFNATAALVSLERIGSVLSACNKNTNLS